MIAFLVVFFSFLLGSIPFGLIVGKVWGSIDVRQHGSGNIGTSNVMRTVGKAAAGAVLVLDVLKGTLPVVAAMSLGVPDWAVAATAFAAVAGHMWSVFLNFEGGKGVATTLGVAIALDLWLALSLVLVWVAVLIVTRYISVGSLASALSLPALTWFLGHGSEYVIVGALICLLVFIRHRSNIERLRAGTEYRFGERAATARVDRR